MIMEVNRLTPNHHLLEKAYNECSISQVHEEKQEEPLTHIHIHF